MNGEIVRYLTSRLLAEREASRVSTFIAAIDGRCGSGKTTVARAVAAQLEIPLIHMDDFFLRPEQRTQERLASPGENVDHERFLEEALIPLSQGKGCRYGRFDCSSMEIRETVQLDPAPLVLVEGSYSHHPLLRPYLDLTVFLNVSPEEQTARILARNGREALNAFQKRWIPLEEAYFKAYSVPERADICLYNGI